MCRQSQASHSQQVDALSSDVSRLSEKCEALAADLARSHKQAQEKEARFR
jgi:outer membrane murein-binding lipoprotein Lpp